MAIPGAGASAIAPSDRDLRRLIFSARGLRAGGGTMEQGGPPHPLPTCARTAHPRGPVAPTGPRTLGESARFVSCLAPARSRPAPRPAEQARNVDLLERARREPHGTRSASGGHRSRGHLAVEACTGRLFVCEALIGAGAVPTSRRAGRDERQARREAPRRDRPRGRLWAVARCLRSAAAGGPDPTRTGARPAPAGPPRRPPR
jgi:hypothetical protein